MLFIILICRALGRLLRMTKVGMKRPDRIAINPFEKAFDGPKTDEPSDIDIQLMHLILFHPIVNSNSRFEFVVKVEEV